jgi:hypothetical protein
VTDYSQHSKRVTIEHGCCVIELPIGISQYLAT